jgi:hypothetical protein
MKRVDNGKVSLVEVMSAIKFPRAKRKNGATQHTTPFAVFKQRARAGYSFSLEDTQLVRSAN